MSPSTYSSAGQSYLSFKEKRSFTLRRQEAYDIKTKYPEKIPLIVERYPKEKLLPRLEKCKFLVPREITVSQLVSIIRSRMQLHPHQTFYLLLSNRNIPNMSSTIAEIYHDEMDKDGYLYMTYASQEMFG